MQPGAWRSFTTLLDVQNLKKNKRSSSISQELTQTREIRDLEFYLKSFGEHVDHVYRVGFKFRGLNL